MANLGELLDALGGLDLDGSTIAEALWLSKQIGDEPDFAAPRAHPPPPDDDREVIAPRTATPESAHPLIPRETGGATTPDGVGAWPSTIEVEIPAPSPLDSAAVLLGELRSLARRYPGDRDDLFDEEASVDRTARTGVAWPVTRPELLRRRELAVVFDRHPSMTAWSGLANSVRTLVDSVGFRQVRSWYMDEDDAGRLLLTADSRRAGHRPLSALSDPSGRRVILVFTACLGEGWEWGTAAADLAGLAARSPVAIVQPFPNSLWNRTGLHWQQGRITSVNPDRPSPLRVLSSTGSGALAIPVLELSPGWLQPWAQLLAGHRRSAGYPLLCRVDSDDRSVRRTRAHHQDVGLGHNPVERVRRFRSASSPEAYRLAVSLAQVPLLLPIMRLVQQAVLPGSRASVLAEVLAGGLIEDATTAAAPYTVPEDSRRFAFRPDVAEVLRSAMPRSEANRVLAAASQFIAQRYNVPGTVFRAAVSRPPEGQGTPFAYLAPETLRAIAPNFPDPPAEPPDERDEQHYDEVVHTALIARSGDLDAELAETRRALATVPVGYRQRRELLRALTDALRRRWETVGDIGSLDEAIAVAKAALGEVPDDETATALSDLGELLLERFTAGGDANFLVDATRVLRTAVEVTAPGDTDRTDLQERCGDALTLRCEITGEPLHGWEAVDRLLASGQSASEQATRDRSRVLMCKVARAYIAVAVTSAYPDADLEDRILGQFRYAVAEPAGSSDGEFESALNTAVEHMVHAIGLGALPAGGAGRLAAILRAGGGPDSALMDEAVRLLIEAESTGRSS